MKHCTVLGPFRLIGLLLAAGVLAGIEPPARADGPRIVNLYNFIRNSDYRVPNSEEVLYDTTVRQIQLLKAARLPGTWALQYDALINPRYQQLLKAQLGPRDEIAAWWEIPRPLAEKAGIAWRGEHDWDPTANVGFSPGYTPAERRKLVDVYMADFKAIYGRYPRTAGSWFMDEVTLEYMAQRYGLVASCNCKDQIGTDGYTLWGSYWNQAYYPSRLDSYMPAQTKAGQIDVPVFRMLGSDPIYQYGNSAGMFTLEPVYSAAGGSADWVAWFINNLAHGPALAFGFTQAGQENPFGWESMKVGLTMQVALLAERARAGEIKIMTLAEAGQWFRRHYALTPPTAVVYLNDWKQQGRKSIWYDSRFYRLNLLWDQGTFYIRDLHLFDERVVASTHDTALTTTSLAYGTLPVMDGCLWSKGSTTAGFWPILLGPGREPTHLVPEGQPVVKESSPTELSVVQPLRGGGSFQILCREKEVVCCAVDAQGQPLAWAWDGVGGAHQKAAVQTVLSDHVTYRGEGVDYQVRLAPDAGSCQQLGNGDLRVQPNAAGKLILTLGGDQ